MPGRGRRQGEETRAGCKLAHAHTNAEKKLTRTETLCHCEACSISVSGASCVPAHQLRPKHELCHDMRVITGAEEPGLANAQFWIAIHVTHAT